MKKSIFSTLALSAALFAGAAHAGVMTYNIDNILPGQNYSVQNTGQTYAGTGYVGMYSYNIFAAIFGLEGDYSRTNMQVGIADLDGKHVTSASLSFVLQENYSSDGVLNVSGYRTNGALGYNFAPPQAPFGVVTGSFTNGYGALTTVDVTSIVQSAVSQGEDWLGMQLYNTSYGRWTYSGAGAGYAADRAQVKLVVNYEDAAVPEPGSLALLGLGLVGFAAARRKKA